MRGPLKFCDYRCLRIPTPVAVGACGLAAFLLPAVFFLFGFLLPGLCLFVIFGIFNAVWAIVLAVSLFADSGDCRANGLWVVALIHFIMSVLSCFGQSRANKIREENNSSGGGSDEFVYSNSNAGAVEGFGNSEHSVIRDVENDGAPR